MCLKSAVNVILHLRIMQFSIGASPDKIRWIILFSWTSFFLNFYNQHSSSAGYYPETGPNLWSNGWMHSRCNLRKAKTSSMHSWNMPSTRGWPCKRNAFHHQRPLRFLHHRWRPHWILQLLPPDTQRFLRWRAPHLGSRSASQYHSPIVHANCDSHHRSWSICTCIWRCEVCSIPVS